MRNKIIVLALFVAIFGISFTHAFAQTPQVSLTEEARQQLIAELQSKLQELLTTLIATLTRQIQDQQATINTVNTKLDTLVTNTTPKLGIMEPIPSIVLGDVVCKDVVGSHPRPNQKFSVTQGKWEYGIITLKGDLNNGGTWFYPSTLLVNSQIPLDPATTTQYSYIASLYKELYYNDGPRSVQEGRATLVSSQSGLITISPCSTSTPN